MNPTFLLEKIKNLKSWLEVDKTTIDPQEMKNYKLMNEDCLADDEIEEVKEWPTEMIDWIIECLEMLKKQLTK